MIRPVLLACAVAAVGALALGPVQAEQKHHAAHRKVDLKRSGAHPLHPISNHQTHAHVRNGKVSHVTVKHNKNGQVRYKKVKTNKRIVSAESPSKTHFVSGDLEQIDSVQFVGFAFYIGGHHYIFWFPVTWVDGGSDGCIDSDDLDS
jgi:hypothetical protein